MDKLEKQEDAAIYFNYQMLPSAQRQIVQQKTGEIRERLRRSAQDIWEIGQRLVEVRAQLKHGQFESWLKDEFGWSRRTAYNFIGVYEAFRESASFAQIDIATSALYLLAAPSTPQSIREEFIERAERGEKITYKDLHQVIKSEKNATESLSSKLRDAAPVGSASSPPQTSERNQERLGPATKTAEIIAVIPKSVTQSNVQLPPNPQTIDLLTKSVDSDSQLFPGWYHLNSQHLLFCGDTASPKFFSRIPHASLILAVTSDDWDHDWIVEKADSVLILRETALKEISLKQLISTFSKPNDVVVFPWLPDPEMLSVAHTLNRKIFAGDPDSMRCARAIAAAKLQVSAAVVSGADF
ncbi:MAG: DUF3102 domain-containing protein [Cyanobacteria bacterium J06626_18]